MTHRICSASMSRIIGSLISAGSRTNLHGVDRAVLPTNMPWTLPTGAAELIMSFLPVHSRWELSMALPRSTWIGAAALGSGQAPSSAPAGYKPILSLALQAGPGTSTIIQQSREAPCSAPMMISTTLTVEELRIFEKAQVKRGYDLRLMIAVQIKRRQAASCLRVVSPFGSGLIIPRVTRIKRGSYHAVQVQIPLEGPLFNRGLACGRNFPLIILDVA